MWQCKEWLPPKAEGGVVPKNERGSVHCPPLAACLPEVIPLPHFVLPNMQDSESEGN